MEIIATFLSQQPFLALFLVVALGYAIGSINIKGFSLGVGAVLFSGLFIGAIAPKAQPPAMVGTLGLVMFLYGLGIQSASSSSQVWPVKLEGRDRGCA